MAIPSLNFNPIYISQNGVFVSITAIDSDSGGNVHIFKINSVCSTGGNKFRCRSGTTDVIGKSRNCDGLIRYRKK